MRPHRPSLADGARGRRPTFRLLHALQQAAASL